MKTKLQATEHTMNGRAREMRKDCKRQTDAKTRRETVSVKLRDRYPGERERRGRKTHPQGKGAGSVQEICPGHRVSVTLREAAFILPGHFPRGRESHHRD